MEYTPKHQGTRFADSPSGDSGKKKQRIIVFSVIGVLLAVAVAALVIMLATGGGSSSKKVVHTEGNRHDVTVAANGGADGGELEGLWKYDNITSYEFDGAGRGVLHTAEDFRFSYSADNGSLFIDLDTDDGNDCEYKYTVDGLTLTMTRGENTYVLTKQI